MFISSETSPKYVETGNNCKQQCNWYYNTSIDRNLRVSFVSPSNAERNTISYFRFYERDYTNIWYFYHT